MARMNIAPTKSNLLSVKDQLNIAEDGYELLEQKREILVMELMHILEQVKLLERDIDKAVESAYPALKHMLMNVGRRQTDFFSDITPRSYSFTEKKVSVGGMTFKTLESKAVTKNLPYSFLNSFAECDRVMIEFCELLQLLARLASIRTIAWRLAREVKKTQRRVNALSKQVIPSTRETKNYIESVLEERERENIFALKALKARNGGR